MTLLKDKSKRNELRRNLYETMESSGQDIPTAVKTLRKILAKNQQDFSKFVGISLSALRRIEQDSGNVTLETIEKILDKFSLKLVVKIKII